MFLSFAGRQPSWAATAVRMFFNSLLAAMIKRHLVTMSLCALVTNVVIADEECIFDQAEQHKRYLQMQKEYAGSRYVEKEHKLVIPKNGVEITLRRGGCAHFGITIEYRIPKTTRYESEFLFFAKIIELVTEYGQELVDPEKLKKTIESKKWHKIEEDNGGYYFVGYEGVISFEAFQKHSAKHTPVVASFYI